MGSVWRQVGKGGGAGGGGSRGAAISAKKCERRDSPRERRQAAGRSEVQAAEAPREERRPPGRARAEASAPRPLSLPGPPRLFGFNLQVAGARPPVLPPAGLAGRAGSAGACGWRLPGPDARPPVRAASSAAAASLNRGVVFVFEPRAPPAGRAAQAGAGGADGRAPRRPREPESLPGRPGAAMELGPELPHRRRLLFACSPPPGPPPVVKALFSGEPAAGGLSPVTHLTATMDQLQGLGSVGEQPAADAKNSSLQRMGSSESTDSGFCLDSPGPLDSKENLENSIRRINSLPPKLLGCSPALKRSHSDSLDRGGFQLMDAEENKENLPSSDRESGEPRTFIPLFMPPSPVPAGLSDEDDGFMDLLEGRV